MANLQLAFTVVFPLFCMMALGYFLRTIRLLDEGTLEKLNRLCFQVFLPLLLFVNVYQSNFRQAFSVKLIVFALAVVVLCFLCLWLVVPRFQKDPGRCAVMIQGIFRSNFILFGIPVTLALFGPGKASITAVLIAFVIPLYNALSVVVLARFSHKAVRPAQLWAGILKNPLILASALAFLFVLTGLRLPQLIETTLAEIAGVATPLALIVLGGGFRFAGARKNASALALCTAGKLVTVPLAGLTLGVLLGFRGAELAALFAMLASPTAVSSFTMAQSAGADHALAGEIVVMTSLFSILTIFLGLSALLALGLI